MGHAKTFIVGTIILIVLLVGFYFLSHYITSATGYAIKSDDPDLIVRCLQEGSFAVYTSPNCPGCERQIKELEEIANHVEVVDCSQNPRECLVLTQLPAFEYNRGLYYGYTEFEELRKITGC